MYVFGGVWDRTYTHFCIIFYVFTLFISIPTDPDPYWLFIQLFHEWVNMYYSINHLFLNSAALYIYTDGSTSVLYIYIFDNDL